MDLKDLVYHVESLSTTSLRSEDQKDLLMLTGSLRSGLKNMLMKFSSDFDLFCVFSKSDLLNEGVKKSIEKIAAKLDKIESALESIPGVEKACFRFTSYHNQQEIQTERQKLSGLLIGDSLCIPTENLQSFIEKLKYCFEKYTKMLRHITQNCIDNFKFSILCENPDSPSFRDGEYRANFVLDILSKYKICREAVQSAIGKQEDNVIRVLLESIDEKLKRLSQDKMFCYLNKYHIVLKNLLQLSTVFIEAFDNVENITFTSRSEQQEKQVGSPQPAEWPKNTIGTDGGKQSSDVRMSNNFMSQEREKAAPSDSNLTHRTDTPSGKLSSLLQLENPTAKKRTRSSSPPHIRRELQEPGRVGAKRSAFNLEPQHDLDKSGVPKAPHLKDSHPLRSLLYRNMYYLQLDCTLFETEPMSDLISKEVTPHKKVLGKAYLSTNGSNLRDSVFSDGSTLVPNLAQPDGSKEVGRLNRKLADLERSNQTNEKYCNPCCLI